MLVQFYLHAVTVTSWSALLSHQRALQIRLCFTQTTVPRTHCLDSSSLITFTCTSFTIAFTCPILLVWLYIPCSFVQSLRSLVVLFVCISEHFLCLFSGFLTFGLFLDFDYSCLLVFGYLALFPGLLSCLWSLPVLFVYLCICLGLPICV